MIISRIIFCTYVLFASYRSILHLRSSNDNSVAVTVWPYRRFLQKYPECMFGFESTFLRLTHVEDIGQSSLLNEILLSFLDFRHLVRFGTRAGQRPVGSNS